MRTLALLLLLDGAVRAQPIESPAPSPEPLALLTPPPPKVHERNWHMGIELTTDFPLWVGGQVWFELPHRIRLSTSFGELPDVYLRTINAVATSAGLYSHNTAELITEAIDRAVNWRVHVGWSPWRNRGGYFEAGFGILELQPGLALADVIQVATGYPAPNVPGIGLGFKLDSIVETVGGEVGWVWYPKSNLTLRLGIGVAAAVGAQVSLKAKFNSTTTTVPFARFGEQYIEQLIEHYLIIPTVALAIGWRLF